MTLHCGETVSFVLGMAGYKWNGDGNFANKAYFRETYHPGNSDKVKTQGALICDLEGSVADCEYKATDEVDGGKPAIATKILTESCCDLSG